MNTMTPSLVRTITPMVVGALATWVLAAIGVPLPIEAAEEFFTAIFSGLYYALVRWAEQHWPWAGWLLGSMKQPVYDTPPLPDDPVVVDADQTDEYVGKHRERTEHD